MIKNLKERLLPVLQWCSDSRHRRALAGAIVAVATWALGRSFQAEHVDLALQIGLGLSLAAWTKKADADNRVDA